jgi:hypothetical protein
LNIHLTNVGGEGSGVDAAELTRQVLQPILAEIITAALNNSSALTKDMGGIGGKAGEEVKKIGDSLKKIFGK